MKAIILSLLVIVFISCEGDYYIEYEWTSMSAHNADNSFEYPELNNSDSIPKEVYSIKLKMEVNELSRKGRYLDRETLPINRTPLDCLVIKSNKDIDNNILAFENISEHFTILNNNYLKTFPADGSKGYPITNGYSEDYYNEPWPTEIDLLLNPIQINNVNRKFYIEFYFYDGSLYSDSTSNIIVY